MTNLFKCIAIHDCFQLFVSVEQIMALISMWFYCWTFYCYAFICDNIILFKQYLILFFSINRCLKHLEVLPSLVIYFLSSLSHCSEYVKCDWLIIFICMGFTMVGEPSLVYFTSEFKLYDSLTCLILLILCIYNGLTLK